MPVRLSRTEDLAGELMNAPMLWNRSIHPEDAAKVDAAIESAMQRHPIDLEYRIQAKDGTWRWMHDQAHLTTDGSGSPVLIGMAMDISERKWMEKALRTSEEKYRALLGDDPELQSLAGPCACFRKRKLVSSRGNPEYTCHQAATGRESPESSHKLGKKFSGVGLMVQGLVRVPRIRIEIAIAIEIGHKQTCPKTRCQQACFDCNSD